MSSYVNQQVYGGAALERLSRSPHAGALKKETQSFKGVHGAFTKACKLVDAAQRDDALEAVGGADVELDQEVMALADNLVGAGLVMQAPKGPRKKAPTPLPVTPPQRH